MASRASGTRPEKAEPISPTGSDPAAAGARSARADADSADVLVQIVQRNRRSRLGTGNETQGLGTLGLSHRRTPVTDQDLAMPAEQHALRPQRTVHDATGVRRADGIAHFHDGYGAGGGRGDLRHRRAGGGFGGGLGQADALDPALDQ